MKGILNVKNTQNYVKSLLVLSIVLSITTGCAVNSNGKARHGAFYIEPQDADNAYQSNKSTGTQACGSHYRVRSGDTLSGIAVKCQVDMSDLARMNGIDAPYFLRVGHALLLPHANNSTAKASQTSKPTIANTTAEKPNDLNWVWPMMTNVPYEYQKDSSGRISLSFYPQIGQPVYAVEAGKVAYAGEDLPNYGKMIVLKHDSGYVTVYAYNHRLEVKKDQQVKAGDLIARAGQSGDAKKPELHFEARYQGRKVNVKGLFKAPPKAD